MLASPVSVIVQHLIERLVRLEHHQRRHQLGDRGDRRGHLGLARSSTLELPSSITNTALERRSGCPAGRYVAVLAKHGALISQQDQATGQELDGAAKYRAHGHPVILARAV